MEVLIETKRLFLRVLNLNDLDAVFNFWGNAEVMKYCGGASHRDKNYYKGAIKRCRDAQEKHGFSPYAVVLKETNEVIGACGYKTTEKDDEVELIYHYAEKYWGNGYGTEAGESCINYARNNLKINKIIASVDPRHVASRKVLEKIGFEYRGMKWFDDTKQEEPYFELIIRRE